MPEFPVTLEGKPVARLSCSEEFAAVLADTVFHGGRFELTGATEKWPDRPAQLVEVLLYGFCVPAEGIEIPHWIPVSERLPKIAPLGVTATVVVAHLGYDAWQKPTGTIEVSPAQCIGKKDDRPIFLSMANNRYLDVIAWQPLPEPPDCAM